MRISNGERYGFGSPCPGGIQGSRLRSLEVVDRSGRLATSADHAFWSTSGFSAEIGLPGREWGRIQRVYALQIAVPELSRCTRWILPALRGLARILHQYAFIRLKVVDCHEDIPRVQGCSLHRCPLCGFWLDILGNYIRNLTSGIWRRILHVATTMRRSNVGSSAQYNT